MQKKKRVIKYLWPLGFGALLLFVPLLRDLHLESALLISTIFCFWGGWKASKTKRFSDFEIISGLALKVLLISIPLIIHGIFAQCLMWTGVGLWVLLPIPSILFGVSIGRFYRKMSLPLPKLLTITTISFVAVGILAYEFFTLPQVYYFNHVWGAWPGPIYDEEIRITAGLLWFRLTTLLWIVLIWWLPTISSSKKSISIVSISGILIIISLFIQPQLRISTPRSFLKSELSEVIKTEHFHIYYDASNFDPDEREYWAARHEFHFRQIIDILEIDWPENQIIESFAYANAWQKKDLVGAKFTSYVPVWLEQDQLHIAKEHLEGVLKHELVHVITKQFGNDLINASWSIGLVEGVAEAIAKDASGVSTLDQIIAAEDPLPTTEQIAAAMSLTGFYVSASSISYTTSGSFVSYLLENYPIDHFKEAYASTDIESAYELPFDTLVTRWKAQLPVTEVDSVDARISQMVFSQRSLFQMSCPRKIHPILRGLDDLRFYESLGNSSNSLTTINSLFNDFPDVPLIKQLWNGYQLRNSNSIGVINSTSTSDTLFSQQLMRADALFIEARQNDAYSIIDELRADSIYINDISAQESFLVRTDSLAWNTFINARYKNTFVDITSFQSLPEPLQWLSIRRVVDGNDNELIPQYAEEMLSKELEARWFETQISLIDKLVYLDQFNLAQSWIDKLLSNDLRDRHIERVEEQQEWLDFRKQ